MTIRNLTNDLVTSVLERQNSIAYAHSVIFLPRVGTNLEYNSLGLEFLNRYLDGKVHGNNGFVNWME